MRAGAALPGLCARDRGRGRLQRAQRVRTAQGVPPRRRRRRGGGAQRAGHAGGPAGRPAARQPPRRARVAAPRRQRLHPPEPHQLPARVRRHRVRLAQRLRDVARGGRHAAAARAVRGGDAERQHGEQRRAHGGAGLAHQLRALRRRDARRELGGEPAVAAHGRAERGDAGGAVRARRGRARQGRDALRGPRRRRHHVRLQPHARQHGQPVARGAHERVRGLQRSRQRGHGAAVRAGAAARARGDARPAVDAAAADDAAPAGAVSGRAAAAAPRLACCVF
mmetsp:Transcript_17825/g.62895  ORF Transcript_17825/g.62895 Transcript_17825/m.62895 type:complete len:280 (+) Transcript_17825:570-1409(+)